MEKVHIVETELNKKFNQIAVSAFTNKRGAFLGALACRIKLIWDKKIPTACVGGATMKWNPDWFQELNDSSKTTVFLHELMHIAFLHSVRLEHRDPKKWNIACDHFINISLYDDGYKFDELEGCCLDFQYRGMSEEEIYEHLPDEPDEDGNDPFAGDLQEGDDDSDEYSEANLKEQVAAVMSAIHSAGSDQSPANIKSYLSNKLAPKISWEQHLNDFMREISNNTKQDWNKRNRRFNRVILPKRTKLKNKLDHLMYFFDVSYSTSDDEVTQFIAELNYIKQTFNPRKITVVQFSDDITDVLVLEENDVVDGVEIVGRGGTDLAPVRAFIEKEQPTAAIIFTDMYCAPMMPIKTPVIWAVVNNDHPEVLFGDVVHIKV